MRIALCGAHRTGKTITASRLADDLGIPFISANVSKCSIWTSFTPSDNMTFAERFEVQDIILAEYTQHIQRSGLGNTDYIMDRSPMDILGYLLCNIDHTTSVLFDRRLEEFIEKCITLSREYFDGFVMIQPGINFVVEPGKDNKVYNSRVYQEALTCSIMGALYRFYHKLGDDKMLIMIPESSRTIDDRICFIKSALLNRLDYLF